MEITFKAFAYADRWTNLDEVVKGESQPHIIPWDSFDGYTQIGTAVVTVTMYPANDIQAKELDRLNKQLQTVRAENQQRENAILDQISKLQALTFQAA